MKSKFLSIPLIPLLVAGCSAPTPVSEPKYEEGAFIQFENVWMLLSKIIKVSIQQQKYLHIVLLKRVKHLFLKRNKV